MPWKKTRESKNTEEETEEEREKWKAVWNYKCQKARLFHNDKDRMYSLLKDGYV